MTFTSDQIAQTIAAAQQQQMLAQSQAAQQNMPWNMNSPVSEPGSFGLNVAQGLSTGTSLGISAAGIYAGFKGFNAIRPGNLLAAHGWGILDPFTMGNATFRGITGFPAGGMGMGLRAAGLAGGLVTGGAMMAAWSGVENILNNVYQGASNYFEDQTLLGAQLQFVNPNARGGRGFDRDGVRQITQATEEIATSLDQDITEIRNARNLMIKTGMMFGATDVKEFLRRFKENATLLVQISKEFNTSLEDAGQLLGAARQSGFFTPRDIMGYVGGGRVAGMILGIPGQEVAQLQAGGAAMARGAGMHGQVGAGLATTYLSNLQMMYQAGTISDRDLELSGGAPGKEGLENLSQKLTAASLSMTSSGLGKVMTVALSEQDENGNFTGRRDNELVSRFRRGELSIDDLKNIARGKMGKENAAGSYLTHQRELGGEMAAIGSIEYMASTYRRGLMGRGYSPEEAEQRVGVILQRHFNMDEGTSETVVRMSRDIQGLTDRLMDQTMRTMSTLGREEQLKYQGTWEGVKRDIERWWDRNVASGARDIGMQVSGSAQGFWEKAGALLWGGHDYLPVERTTQGGLNAWRRAATGSTADQQLIASALAERTAGINGALGADITFGGDAWWAGSMSSDMAMEQEQRNELVRAGRNYRGAITGYTRGNDLLLEPLLPWNEDVQTVTTNMREFRYGVAMDRALRKRLQENPELTARGMGIVRAALNASEDPSVLPNLNTSEGRGMRVALSDVARGLGVNGTANVTSSLARVLASMGAEKEGWAVGDVAGAGESALNAALYQRFGGDPDRLRSDAMRALGSTNQGGTGVVQLINAGADPSKLLEVLRDPGALLLSRKAFASRVGVEEADVDSGFLRSWSRAGDAARRFVQSKLTDVQRAELIATIQREAPAFAQGMRARLENSRWAGDDETGEVGDYRKALADIVLKERPGDLAGGIVPDVFNFYANEGVAGHELIESGVGALMRGDRRRAGRLLGATGYAGLQEALEGARKDLSRVNFGFMASAEDVTRILTQRGLVDKYGGIAGDIAQATRGGSTRAGMETILEKLAQSLLGGPGAGAAPGAEVGIPGLAANIQRAMDASSKAFNAGATFVEATGKAFGAMGRGDVEKAFHEVSVNMRNP